MGEMGLVPDTVCYTSLIIAYNKIQNYDKCWEIYENCELHQKADDTLRSIMIRICAATHDAEKGLRLWDTIQQLGFLLNTESYNAILFALSSRAKYAEETLLKFRRMIEDGVVPDSHTTVAVLRATSKIGDVKTASDLTGYMK